MHPVTHFEIPAADRARAIDFYTGVFDWDLEEIPLGDDVYASVRTTPTDGVDGGPGGINGAIIDRDDHLTAPVITVEVDSITDQIDRIEAAGGSPVVAPDEVIDMGHYAYVRDTEGNVIGLWQSMPSD